MGFLLPQIRRQQNRPIKSLDPGVRRGPKGGDSRPPLVPAPLLGDVEQSPATGIDLGAGDCASIAQSSESGQHNSKLRIVIHYYIFCEHLTYPKCYVIQISS
jgi:hypothetical protein